MSGFRHGEILDELGCSRSMHVEPSSRLDGYLSVLVHEGSAEDEPEPAHIDAEEATRLGMYLLDWAAYQEGQANGE